MITKAERKALMKLNDGAHAVRLFGVPEPRRVWRIGRSNHEKAIEALVMKGMVVVHKGEGAEMAVINRVGRYIAKEVQKRWETMGLRTPCDS
jgi:hypothetical protein